jgi:hypothetical protein
MMVKEIHSDTIVMFPNILAWNILSFMVSSCGILSNTLLILVFLGSSGVYDDSFNCVCSK